MATFQWGDALVRISEIPRGVALTCFRELEFMAMAWLNVNVGEDAINRDIATMLVVAAPATIVQGDKIVRIGEVIVNLPEGETATITLPMTREKFDELPLSVSDLWIEAASKANEKFLDELKKALTRITQTIRDLQSASAVSNEPAQATQATTTDGK